MNKLKYLINFNCDFFLKKNGKYKYIPNNNDNKIYCVLKNYLKVCEINNFNQYTNLFLINSAKKKNLKYIKEKNKILCFYNKNIDIALFLLYRKNLLYNKEMIMKLFSNNLKTLTYIFMINKLVNIKILNKDLFIKIFYNHYIFMIENELEKKYKKNINSFSNYHELYMFLKDKNYVKKYYNVYVPKIIKNYKKMYNYIISQKDYKLFIKKKHMIKNFKDIVK
jgi:hypothetical protein